jgi:hypothetical protein
MKGMTVKLLLSEPGASNIMGDIMAGKTLNIVKNTHKEVKMRKTILKFMEQILPLVYINVETGCRYFPELAC